MDYTEDQFLDLVTAVEEQGGELLDTRCIARTDKVPRQKDGELTGQDMVIQVRACGKQAVFKIHYEGGAVTACAVCDSIGKWPRFAKKPEEA